MAIHLFKTNLITRDRIKHISPLFKNHPFITDWSVDLEDCDNVLRLVTKKPLNEGEIIYMINTCGYQCELLID